MASLRWALLCDRVLVDQTRNTVTYVEAVEDVVVPEVPCSLPPFYVAALWDRHDAAEEIKMRLRLLTPTGEATGEMETVLRGDAMRHRAHVAIGMTVTTVGTHRIAIDVSDGSAWTVVASVPLNVQLAPVFRTEDLQPSNEAPEAGLRRSSTGKKRRAAD